MTNINTTDHWLDSAHRGCRIYLRRRHDASRPSLGAPVLFVHGATYASTLTFDYPVDGVSWMDALVADGFDVWCVDLLGYGRSDRPPAMAVSASDNLPLVDTEQASIDVKTAMDHVLAESGRTQLSLIGYSWGSAICGGLAGAYPDLLERLVLYGALWLKDVPSAITGAGTPDAYRLVSADAMVKRWQGGLDATQRAAITSTSHMQSWAENVLASDDAAAASGCLRAPSGVVKDVLQFWSAGRPTYNPANILAATLVIVGEWDRETTPAQGKQVFDQLQNAAEREYVVVGRATHSMLLERQHRVLRRHVSAFLSHR